MEGTNLKPIKLSQILDKINYIQFIGNQDEIITGIIKPDKTNKNKSFLMWCGDRFKDSIQYIKYGTLIISKNAIENLNENCNYIIVENPRLTFSQILKEFFTKKRKSEISSSASIHENVIIGNDVFIGENVVIEENCQIGNNVTILHNSVILSDTYIGSNVYIGANCTIGGIGFGYEKNENNQFQLIQHIGNVIIEDYVEIGNNTCIDRAVLGSTFLHENVKVDNLVHIAHGVNIGKNSVIIANSMIAGSVCIGENVWVAPSASILNQKVIKSNSFIGIGAVVLKNVDEKEIIAGNPGKVIKTID